MQTHYTLTSGKNITLNVLFVMTFLPQLKTWRNTSGKNMVHSRKRKRKPSATQTKEEAERAEGDDRDEDEDYVPSEEPSSEDPPYKPTKKELKRANKEGEQ